MGRPEKNNADYFSHDADMRNDRKIKAIIGKFWLPGYAIWNMLLETFTWSDHFTVTITDSELILMAGDFYTEKSTLIDILDFLQSIDLIQRDGQKYRCQKLIDRLGPLVEKREKMKQRFEKKSIVSAAETWVSAAETPLSAAETLQSKVKIKQSKVKIKVISKDITKRNSNIISAKVFADDSFQHKAAKFFLENKITNPQVNYQVNKQGEEELLQKWADEVDKMSRIDGYTEEQIDYILKYTLQNEFWNNQILSMKKFRDKNPNGVPYFVVMVGEVKKQKEATPKKSKKKVWE